jgi:HlyD family secretion protein
MADQGTNRTRNIVWAIVAVVVLAGGFFLIRNMTRSAVTVRVARVAYEDMVSTVSTNGKVQPVVDFQAHSPAPGVVQKLFVSVGDKVAKGQELVRMDTSDAVSRIAAAQASLSGNQNSLENMRQGGTQEELLAEKADMTAAQEQQKQATASLSALQALQAKGAASANEVQAAQQRLTDAENRIAQLQARRSGRFSSNDLAVQRSNLAQARSSLSAAQSAYKSSDIRAPFSGTVYAVPIAQYDYVGGGEALLNVANLNRIRVNAYFDEPDIGKLENGQPVKILWDAKPNRTWQGHIAQVPTTVINYGTRNVGECVITVDDAKGDLLPNTNVTAVVTTQHLAHALSVPREALHTEGLTNYVYRIVNGKLARTDVQVGVVNLTRAQVTGGIGEGDTVVLGATTEADLSDGMPVKAQP